MDNYLINELTLEHYETNLNNDCLSHILSFCNNLEHFPSVLFVSKNFHNKTSRTLYDTYRNSLIPKLIDNNGNKLTVYDISFGRIHLERIRIWSDGYSKQFETKLTLPIGECLWREIEGRLGDYCDEILLTTQMNEQRFFELCERIMNKIFDWSPEYKNDSYFTDSSDSEISESDESTD